MCFSTNPRKEDINKRKIKQGSTVLSLLLSEGMNNLFFSSYLKGPIEERTNSKIVNLSKNEIFYTEIRLYQTSLSSKEIRS